jgi:hypothetical protein
MGHRVAMLQVSPLHMRLLGIESRLIDDRHDVHLYEHNGDPITIPPTPTTQDWAFYANFHMTKHLLVIETMHL